MDYLNKAVDFTSTALQKIVPIVVVFIIIKLVFAYITALMGYQVWISWWNDNGGSKFNATFDIHSMACFTYSKLLFNIRQLLVPASAGLN